MSETAAKAKTVAYKLYLSVMVVLVGIGFLGQAYFVAAYFHDSAVYDEALQCVERELKIGRQRGGFFEADALAMISINGFEAAKSKCQAGGYISEQDYQVANEKDGKKITFVLEDQVLDSLWTKRSWNSSRLKGGSTYWRDGDGGVATIPLGFALTLLLARLWIRWLLR